MVANAVPAPVFGPISQVGEHHFRRVLNGIRRPRGCVATTDGGAIGLAERLHLLDREFDGGAIVLWCDQRGDEPQQIQAKDLG